MMLFIEKLSQTLLRFKRKIGQCKAYAIEAVFKGKAANMCFDIHR